jgi:serine/threonine protein kinase
LRLHVPTYLPSFLYVSLSSCAQGYGREADLWSVGVIMFLLLCGKLPFDGEDHNEIIRSTIQVRMHSP